MQRFTTQVGTKYTPTSYETPCGFSVCSEVTALTSALKLALHNIIIKGNVHDSDFFKVIFKFNLSLFRTLNKHIKKKDHDKSVLFSACYI